MAVRRCSDADLIPRQLTLTPPGSVWRGHSRAILIIKLGKARLSGRLAKFDGSGNRRATGVGVCSVPPHPNPSPRRGRNIHPSFDNPTELGCRVPPKRKTKKRGLQPQRPNNPAWCQRSPSPWGEGGGEGERSKLQLQAHDDSRNRHPSRAFRQSRGFPNLVMSTQASSAKRRAQKKTPRPTGSARTSSLNRKLARVKLFLCDVDGVLTDASVWIGAENEIKRFNIQDGLGMLLLQVEGIKVGWISNRPSPATTLRAQELKIDFLHQQKGKKVDAIEGILGLTGSTWSEVCYMGDDIVDLAALKRAGVAVAVPNANEEARAMADYVTKAPGGCGAVREVVELILKAQHKWSKLIEEYSA